MADGGAEAVAGMDDGGIGKLHELVFQRGEDLVERTTPEVRSADAPGEESVTRKELRLSESSVVSVTGKVERDAAGRVAGSVDNVREEVAPLEDIPFLGSW